MSFVDSTRTKNRCLYQLQRLPVRRRAVPVSAEGLATDKRLGQIEATHTSNDAIVFQVRVAGAQGIVRIDLIIDTRAYGCAPLRRWKIVRVLGRSIGARSQKVCSRNGGDNDAVIINLTAFRIDEETGLPADGATDIASEEL